MPSSSLSADPPSWSCPSEALADAGPPQHFTLADGTPAFAIRWQGRVHAWRNVCAHAAVRLDFEGEVFERGRRYLMCPKHGAIYEPDTGLCVGGPCRGARLVRVAVREADGQVRPAA